MSITACSGHHPHKTQFEALPNEVWYECFQYLEPEDIKKGFSELNFRSYTTTASYFSPIYKKLQDLMSFYPHDWLAAFPTLSNDYPSIYEDLSVACDPPKKLLHLFLNQIFNHKTSKGIEYFLIYIPEISVQICEDLKNSVMKADKVFYNLKQLVPVAVYDTKEKRGWRVISIKNIITPCFNISNMYEIPRFLLDFSETTDFLTNKESISHYTEKLTKSSSYQFHLPKLVELVALTMAAFIKRPQAPLVYSSNFTYCHEYNEQRKIYFSNQQHNFAFIEYNPSFNSDIRLRYNFTERRLESVLNTAIGLIVSRPQVPPDIGAGLTIEIKDKKPSIRKTLASIVSFIKKSLNSDDLYS